MPFVCIMNLYDSSEYAHDVPEDTTTKGIFDDLVDQLRYNRCEKKFDLWNFCTGRRFICIGKLRPEKLIVC